MTVHVNGRLVQSSLICSIRQSHSQSESRLRHYKTRKPAGTSSVSWWLAQSGLLFLSVCCLKISYEVQRGTPTSTTWTPSSCVSYRRQGKEFGLRLCSIVLSEIICTHFYNARPLTDVGVNCFTPNSEQLSPSWETNKFADKSVYISLNWYFVLRCQGW